MASNVLSPDQGGWKFWAGCGSSEPRLQPPGTFPGPRLRPRCPGALLRQGPRATTCPWPQGPPGPGHTAGTAACWTQELRLHPWVLLAFFSPLPFCSFHFTPFALFLSALCRTFPCFSSSLFALSLPLPPVTFPSAFLIFALFPAQPTLPSRCSTGPPRGALPSTPLFPRGSPTSAALPRPPRAALPPSFLRCPERCGAAPAV